MQYKKRIIGLSAVLAGGLAIGLFYTSSAGKNVLNYTRGTSEYGFTFSKTSNKLDASLSSADINTINGNPITFNYSELGTYSSGWMTFKTGAEFYNPKTLTGDYNAISGLSSLTITYTGDTTLFISYGWLSGANYEFTNQPLTSGVAFTFENYSPSYFKIVNLHSATASVTELEIEYECLEGTSKSAAHTITINENNGTSSYGVSTNENGGYSLSPAYKEGYNFSKWVKVGTSTEFAATGTLEDDVSIEAIYEIDGTDTFTKLKKRCNAGTNEIVITDDIEITSSITVNGNVSIVAAADYEISRGTSFTGSMFKMSSGSNLTIGSDDPEYDGVLTFNGRSDDGLSANANGGVIWLYRESWTTDMSVTLKNARFINNECLGGNGGAIYINSQKVTLDIDNCEFINNHVTANVKDNDPTAYEHGAGGAIHIWAYCTASISNSSFEDNEAIDGGAIYAEYSTINVAGSTFDHNIASQTNVTTTASGGNGGAIKLVNKCSLTIGNNSEFVNNEAILGGVLYSAGSKSANRCTTIVQNTNIHHNSATTSGGAFYSGSSYSTFTFNNGTIFNSNECTASGSLGGAVYMGKYGIANINNGTSFTNNSSMSQGGAIYLTSTATMTMDGSLLSGNTASSGGAISLRGTGAISISNTEFVQNVATGNGGAIYGSLSSGTAGISLTLDSIIASKNTAGSSGNGGVIYVNASRNHSITFNGISEIDTSDLSVVCGGKFMYLSSSTTLSLTEANISYNGAEAGTVDLTDMDIDNYPFAS